MPKSKRMRNNASSVRNENKIIDFSLNSPEDAENDGNELIAKHCQMIQSYLGQNGSQSSIGNYNDSEKSNEISQHNNDDEFDNQQDTAQSNEESSPNQQTTLSSNETQNQVSRIIVRRQFSINRAILKTLLRSNFPPRYPVKLEIDDMANFVIQESNEELVPTSINNSKMTKNFIKFWNRFITKQDISTSSVLDHQLTDKDAGYYPCQLKTLFSSPESYIRKPFCHRERYTGHGHQLLPSANSFSKIAARSVARMEVSQILQHYSESINQYFLIPIELTSNLSRSMLRSVEICNETQGCNKINFICKSQDNIDDCKHPVFTIEYKTSVEQEVMPPSNFSFMDNYSQTSALSPSFQNPHLQHALFNYPYLNHIFTRNDFWCDDLFAKFWHYSRYFCDKLDLGNRMNNVASISIKDAWFKYLLSCSARICVAIKFWVLNPEGASYFRCSCGHRIYDSKQENKLLSRFGIGSSALFLHQCKINEQDSFHQKHERKSHSSHICACGSSFKDHTSWINHAISLKVFDVNKMCPIVLYNCTKISQHENRYVCECNMAFSDYDFWSFWLHVGNCKVFKNSVKTYCSCNNKVSRSPDNRFAIKSTGKRGASSLKVNRKRKSTKNQLLKMKKSKFNESFCPNDGDDMEKELEESAQYMQDDCWQSGDKLNQTSKMSKQYNSNHLVVTSARSSNRSRKSKNT